MNDILGKYIATHDYYKVTEDAVSWIRDWFRVNGPDSPAVIGISGGKDSTVTAALCKEALGAERVLGVMMPNGVQPDIDVSRRVIETLGIPSVEINIQNAYKGVMDAVLGADLSLSRQAEINLGPRLRMATLYAVSQCVNGRVSNNSNRSERYVGYSTRYGDSVGDFAPLANLTVTEVRTVGAVLGIPSEFVQKAPSDGLSGHTDEDALGFTYDALDTWILTGTGDPDILERIEKKHKANAFKLEPMPEFRPAK